MNPYVNPPSHCDICKSKIVDRFYDGKTLYGPWANMCGSCYCDKGSGPDFVTSWKKVGNEFYKTKDLLKEAKV